VITYLGFRLIEGVLARLPRRLAYAIGVVTSTLAFPLLARQRKALESNLHHVLPAMPGPQLRKLAWRNWLNYTKAWIDFFKIPRMDRRRLGGLVAQVPPHRCLCAGRALAAAADARRSRSQGGEDS